MDESNNLNLKEIFKKIGAVIGVLATLVLLIQGVIFVYKEFYPNGPRVIASCDYYLYELPPYVVDFMKYIKKDEPDKISIVAQDVSIASTTLMNLLESGFYYDSYRYNDKLFWKILVKNAGNMQAEEVIIDTPFSGIAVVESSTERKVFYFNKLIELGEIRPGKKIDVRVWSFGDYLSYPYLGYTNDDIFVNYKDGKGEVKFGIIPESKIKRCFYKINPVWFLPTGLIVIIFAYIWEWWKDKKKCKQ